MEITTDLNSNNDVVGFRPVFQFGTGKDKKGKSELYAIPALGWNGHDRLMVGALLHNYSFSDKKTQYYLIPLYSTGQKTVSGIAALNHHIGLSGPGAGLDINLQAKKFSWSQDGIHSFSYTKIKPSVSYDLARSSHRSLKFNSISLQYHYIDFNPLFDLETDRRESFNENYLSIDNWQFLVLEYRHKNKKAINPYSLTVEFEQGITSNLIYRGMRDTLINGMDTIISMPLTGPPQKDQSTHTKLSAIFEYNLDIGIKKKPLRFRAYMSYFINTPDHGYFYHRISNAGITRDYRFDELVMYRGADTGLFAQQISSRKEHSKFVSTIGQSDRMLANLNISIPIPGKIPIRAYLELMTFTDIDKSGFNASGASLIYNFGLELTIIPTVLTVYINLAQNSDVSNWQDQVWRSRTGNSGDDGFPFVNKITFRLDLRNLTPTELKKSINLF
jgi:hypothetical protein